MHVAGILKQQLLVMTAAGSSQGVAVSVLTIALCLSHAITKSVGLARQSSVAVHGLVFFWCQHSCRMKS
jgi:hypothetical protein